MPARRTAIGLATLLASALATAPVAAQTSAEGTPAAAADVAGPGVQLPPVADFIAEQGPERVLVSDIMGVLVVGPDGQDIGTVDDLLADREGRVVAVIVGVGGFLGIGDKDVAIPIEALVLDLEEAPVVVEPAAGSGPPHETHGDIWGWRGGATIDRVITAYSRAELEEAPGFERFDD